MLRLLFLLVAATSLLAAGAEQTTNKKAFESSPVVETLNGPVRGRIIRAANGRYGQEFLNIPFAQPPTGELRFKPPKPLQQNWSTARDGTKLGNACAQGSMDVVEKYFKDSMLDIFSPPNNMDEDCLNLNVYTPYPAPSSGRAGRKSDSEIDIVGGAGPLLPVMVWIHGGGFQWGSNSLHIYNGSILATEINVIVVAINYRLGVFGFFTLDGPTVSSSALDGVRGNQGLLDQALALQWVQDNIARFGGDPQKVTIFGESAGGASVHYHTLSPLSRDRFSHAILQSGTAVSFWAYQTPQQAQQSSREFAALAGCNGTNDGEIFACFKTKSVKDLLAVDSKFQHENIKMKLVPTSDGVFLTKSPAQALEEGDFKKESIMVGTTKDESISLLFMFWPDLLAKQFPNVRLTLEEFDKMFSTTTAILGNASRDAIKFSYRNWTVPESDTDALASDRWQIMKNVFDDLFMNNGLVELLDAYRRHKVPAYRYTFEQISARQMWGYDFNGAVHGDDVPFVMGMPLNPEYKFPVEEVDLSRRVMHMFGEFARTGKPGVSGWQPYAGNQEYFTISADEYGKIKRGPERWRFEFCRRAVPYLEKLQAQAGVAAARAAASE